ncbi:TonB-dependent receptor, partial [Acinetobacter baumannii]
PQTNIGYDLGAVWAPNKSFKIDVTGFYEFFQNELISQSPGAGLLSYTFNAPASEHRGIEIASTVKPLTGVTWTTAYL